MHAVTAMLASILAATTILAAPGFAAAMIPTGSFELHFGGRQSIWMGEEGVDPGEEFCAGLAAAFDPLEFCDFQVLVDGRGSISGYLEFSGWSGGLHFTERGLIRGTQRGDDRSGISRVSLKIKLTGTASDGFETLSTRSSIRLSRQTTAEGLVSGVWTTRVCIRGLGCNEVEEPVAPTILTNGGWSLAIDITDAGGGELGGGARVEFGNGSECYYAVDGTYNARKDTARLNLRPTEPACAGTSLRLKDVRLLPQLLEPRFGRRSFVFVTPFDSPSITYRLFGFRGATHLNLLPLRGALENHYSNQEIFAFICQGTVEIAASVDPSACSWTIFDGSSGGGATITTSTPFPVFGGVQQGGFQPRPRLELINGSATIGVIQLP